MLVRQHETGALLIGENLMASPQAEEVILALRGEALCPQCKTIVPERFVINEECHTCFRKRIATHAIER